MIEVILSDPDEADVDSLRPTVLDEAITAASTEIARAPYLIRFVFSYTVAAGLQLQFAVASNGAPVMFAASAPPLPGLKGLSVGGPEADA